jgi:hypothetical protein
MPALHEDDPRLLAWTRAHRRHAKQERITAAAIQYAAQATYFAECRAACTDARARAILARAAMKEHQRRLANRREELKRAEQVLAPILRTYYQRSV